MKMIKSMLLCAVVVSSFAGCAMGPGDKPADVPPRLALKDNVHVWDNPAAFGPVPASLAAKGQAVCAALDTKDVHYKATGYHPKAQGPDGKSFAEGGYFCVQK